MPIAAPRRLLLDPAELKSCFKSPSVAGSSGSKEMKPKTDGEPLLSLGNQIHSTFVIS